MENKITLSENNNSTELERQILKGDTEEVLTLLDEAVLDSNISGSDMVNLLIKMWIVIPWIVEDFMNTDFWDSNPEILLKDANWNRRYFEWTLDKMKIAEVVKESINNIDRKKNKNFLLEEKNMSKSLILKSSKRRIWIVVSIAIISAAFWSYFTNLIVNDDYNGTNQDKTEKTIPETKIIWNNLLEKIRPEKEVTENIENNDETIEKEVIQSKIWEKVDKVIENIN